MLERNGRRKRNGRRWRNDIQINTREGREGREGKGYDEKEREGVREGEEVES